MSEGEGEGEYPRSTLRFDKLFFPVLHFLYTMNIEPCLAAEKPRAPKLLERMRRAILFLYREVLKLDPPWIEDIVSPVDVLSVDSGRYGFTHHHPSR